MIDNTRSSNNVTLLTQRGSLGGEIDKLIQAHLDSLNTIFLARVCKVYDGMVSITNVVRKNPDVPNVLFHDIPIAYLNGKAGKFISKVQKDDLGLAVVIQQDITMPKQGHYDMVPNTLRKFDANDALYIPLTWQAESYDANLSIKSESNELRFEDEKLIAKGLVEFTEPVDLSGDKVTIRNELNVNKITTTGSIKIDSPAGSLADVINSLLTLLDSLAAGMKGGATNPAEYHVQKAIINAKLKSILG